MKSQYLKMTRSKIATPAKRGESLKIHLKLIIENLKFFNVFKTPQSSKLPQLH